jgi:hypothetical protein
MTTDVRSPRRRAFEETLNSPEMRRSIECAAARAAARIRAARAAATRSQ